MSVFKQSICDTILTTRFADVIDFQGNSQGKFNTFIKYFDDDDELRELSYDQYRHLVYAAAYEFEKIINEEINEDLADKEYVAVAYLSNSDKDCIINQMSLMYLNITPVLLSPKNSLETTIHLLKESGANILVHDLTNSDMAKKCQLGMPKLKLASKLTFSSEIIHPLKAPKVVMKSRGLGQVVLMLHSSGSTALPKLIKLTNRSVLTFIQRSRDDPDELAFVTRNLFTSAPMFHAFGLSLVWRVIFRGTTIVIASVNMSPRKIVNQAKSSDSNSLALLPLQIKQVVEHCMDISPKSGWELLKNISSFGYSGAALPINLVEDLIMKGFKVYSIYGSSEVGLVGTCLYSSKSNNLRELRLCASVSYTIIDRAGDSCQILINKDDLGLAEGVCNPEEDGYLTGDLVKLTRYSPETKEIKFEYAGRANDTIVQISGEKTNPVPMEEAIAGSKYVEKCVVIGQGRLNNCLLIQLSTDTAIQTSNNVIIRDINDKIYKANANSPSYSRIDQDLVYILPLKTEKVLPATAKGNVIRSKVEDLFKEEIENIYANFGVPPPLKKFKAAIKNDSKTVEYIKRIFQEVTGHHLISNKSFFDLGMDSLSAVKFTNQLKFLYPKSKMSINIVYEMDILDALANYINDISKGKKLKLRTLKFYQNEVDTLLTQYSKFTEIQTVEKILPHKNDKLNVLVTGANGSLGSFVIKSLLERDQVGYIYGLVRAPNNEEAIKKLKSELFSRKVDLSLDQWSRVKAFAYITDDPRLGLSAGDYKIIFDTTDIIYHVAWRMDFLKGVREFKDCIEGTVNLLKISATSPKKPAFHFTSTVGAALPVSTTPEIEEDRPSTTLVNIESCNGYNLSKLVSEILCFEWAENFGFSLDIHRLGQVSGDTVNGIWNVREHIPLLIKAAQVMKIVPESFMESVAWVPVDYAANAMVEINFAANNFHKGTVNHIVNPNSTSWKKIIVILQELGVECKPVSNKEFVEALHSHAEFQDVDINPLASLADFFTVLLDKKEPLSFEMKTEETSRRSLSINTCPIISEELMIKIINSWIAIGFLAKTKTTNVAL